MSEWFLYTRQFRGFESHRVHSRRNFFLHTKIYQRKALHSPTLSTGQYFVRTRYHFMPTVSMQKGFQMSSAGFLPRGHMGQYGGVLAPGTQGTIQRGSCPGDTGDILA